MTYVRYLIRDPAPIEMEGVVKRFGRFTALDGLDLWVEPGQIHGFLGPNGAGKSTTIRVLLGLLRADAGQVHLLGGDPWRDAPRLHRQLAYVPGDVSLWPNLSGGEAIDLIGKARGGLNKARRAELIEAFDFDPRKKGRAYSKGNRQKAALIAALASDVSLLLLDEPTSGLDPLMERTFTQIVRERAKEGVTVLLSSHILSEVEALCDVISIIRAGKIVDSGSLDQLRHLTNTQVTASVQRPLASRLPRQGIQDLAISGDQITCQVESSALDGLTAALSTMGLTSLTCTPPTLEELFMRHYASDSTQPPSGDSTGQESA